MKIVAVLFVTLTVDLDQAALRENDSDGQKLQDEEIDRSGYGQPGFNRPMVRPPPNPVALNAAVCYVCNNCPKVFNSTSSKYCPHTIDPTKQGKCVVYAEHYKHTKTPIYIRGCASERGSCTDIRKAYTTHTDVVKLLNCEECEGDRCNSNSASLSLVDLTMACFAMVVSPLVAKYMLS